MASGAAVCSSLSFIECVMDKRELIRPLCRFDEERDCFVLSSWPNDPEPYVIEACRVLSPAGFLDFLFQINTHDWACSQHLGDFVKCYEAYVRLFHNDFPQTFLNVVCAAMNDMDDPGSV